MASDLCRYCQAEFAGTTLSVTCPCLRALGRPAARTATDSVRVTRWPAQTWRQAPSPGSGARHPGHLAARLTSRVRRLVQPPLNRAASGLVLEYRPAGLRYQKLNFDYWATGPQPALRGDRTRRRL